MSYNQKITQFNSPKVLVRSEDFQYNFYTDSEKTISDDKFVSSEISGFTLNNLYNKVYPRVVNLSLNLRNLKDFNQVAKNNKANIFLRNKGLRKILNNLEDRKFLTGDQRERFFNERLNLNQKFYQESEIELTFDEDLSFMYNVLVDALDTEEPNEYVTSNQENEAFLSYSQKKEFYNNDVGTDLRNKQKLGINLTKNIDFLDRVNKILGNSYKGFLEDSHLLSNRSYINNNLIFKSNSIQEKKDSDRRNKSKNKPFINVKTLFKTAEYINRLTEEDDFEYNLGVCVGILIDKFLIDDNLNKNYLCSKFVNFDDNDVDKEISDSSIKYDSKYIYEFRSVHLFIKKDIESNIESHSFYFVLGDKTTTNILYIVERQSPDVPTNLFCNYDFNEKGISLSWGMPNNPQFDIFNFQVFRRESLTSPYMLIKEIRGKDVNVLDDSSFENPAQEIVDRSGTKFNFIDKEISHDKIYIYSICAVDAHGMSSALSVQVACKFNRLTSTLETDTVSLAGALKYYPNQFIPRKTKFFDNENAVFSNTPIVKNKSKFTIYFTPDYQTIINKNESNEIIKFANNQNHNEENDSHYIFNLTDIDTLNHVSQNIYIKRNR